MRAARPIVFLASVVSGVVPLFAGFASTEAYLPSVGRVPGKNGAQFYTTVWATNLTTAPQTFTFRFLKAGQSNPSPPSFDDTLAPGETRVYENVVESKLGLTNALGAARITSSGEIFVSERIYNQAPGDDLGNTEGLFFAGVPKSFSISAGQSASIQGVDQGSSENFRYNFALIETGGGSADVNVQVFDGSGTLLGQRSFPLSPYEQIQPSVADVVPSIATTNARVTATVIDGDGSVLLAGAQVANESEDSTGFEMTFRDDLLGGSSGSGGLTAVAHDSTLIGNGTSTSPLGVNPEGVVKSVNGLHSALTLAAGSNITITPSGNTLTVASSGGGGGGLTLPFSGSTSGSGTAFAISNTGTGDGIHGSSASTGGSGTGVYGTTHGISGETGWAGVWGDSHDGTAVEGTSFNDHGVLGITSGGSAAVEGLNRDTNGIGVLGRLGDGSGSLDRAGVGVWGDSAQIGVAGSGGYKGVAGYSTAAGGIGVFGESSSTSGVNFGVVGSAGSIPVEPGSTAGVVATSNGGFGLWAYSQADDAIYCDGSGEYTGSWSKASDIRFKKNVAPLESALARTLQLRGVSFDWRREEFPDRNFPASQSIGFIAQEVEAVYPQLVSIDRDGYESVDYAGLTPILVEAIKEQQQQLDSQTRRIESQERALQELTRRVERLEKSAR